MTRRITEKTKAIEYWRTVGPFPSDSEQMSLEEMILGYTRTLTLDFHSEIWDNGNVYENVFMDCGIWTFNTEVD